MLGQRTMVLSGAAKRSFSYIGVGSRMRWFIGGLLLGVVTLGIGGPVYMAGHTTALPGEAWFGGQVIAIAAAVSSDAPDKPEFSDELLSRGKHNYSQLRCAFCHADANDKQRIAPNESFLFPPPRNFQRGDSADRSDEQLYWAISNGIGFSAMPSYGTRLSEDEIWSLVAYIQVSADGTAEAIPLVTPTPVAPGN